MNSLILTLLAVFLTLSSTRSWSQNQNGFTHPGLLHSREDLNRMKEAFENKKEPIFTGFKALEESLYSKANYQMRGPFPEWGRAPNIRAGEARSDARAAYENALMWAVTGNKDHANKAIQIINAWAGSLKKVSGIDGVLAAGIQGVKFANAAEILRYTESGWSEEDAKKCEKWFMEAWYPTIEHYAYFANGNWETAALQTNMAIAVYCNDRELFESTVKYSIAGAGNGSIPHMIVYPSGQCQETTRAQHYAQLGIGLLSGATEIAWNQGIDLYGWDNNRLLKGYEYIAKYGLGEEVPYQHYLDRTGKYGLGGKHQNYTKISTVSRGNFYPIFERIQNHYTKRREIKSPYSSRVVKMKRPEGPTNDYVGLGTLTHWRNKVIKNESSRVPGPPAGLTHKNLEKGTKIEWVKSVDPVNCIDANHYELTRSLSPEGSYKTIATNIKDTKYIDEDIKKGTTYYYKIRAFNEIGASALSATLAACAGLPPSWKQSDVGEVKISGYSLFDGEKFTLEGAGKEIGGTVDSFHFAFVPMKKDSTITARIIRPMSSQWTSPGVMIRKNLDSDSPHASVLLLPHWSGALVSRSSKGAKTQILGSTELGETHVIKKNRLSTPYWIRIKKSRQTITGFLSADGNKWNEIGKIKLDFGDQYLVGLPACSQLDKVSTTVTYDSVVLQKDK